MEEFYAIQYFDGNSWLTCETEDAQAEIFRNREAAEKELYEWKYDTGEEDNYRLVKVTITSDEVKYDA